MPVPETTSAEAFPLYVGGKVLRAGQGKAWREVKAWAIAPPRETDLVSLPSVGEPFLAWTMSGEVEFQEREGKRPWITHRLRKGSFFLTCGGAPCEVRWKAVSAEPSRTRMLVLNADTPASFSFRECFARILMPKS